MILMRSAAFLFVFLPAFAFSNTVGSVVVAGKGATINAKPLLVQAAVNVGDVIVTGERGVKLLMIDDSILDLAPKSELKVGHYAEASNEQLPRAEWEVGYGSVRALVAKSKEKKPQYFFRTKWSLMAVRGTEILIDGNSRFVVVFSGRLDFSCNEWMKNPMSVTSGQKLTLKSETALVPSECSLDVRLLSAAELADYALSARLSDDTFTATLAENDAERVVGSTKLAQIPSERFPGQKDLHNPIDGIRNPGLTVTPPVAGSTSGSAGGIGGGGADGSGGGEISGEGSLTIKFK